MEPCPFKRGDRVRVKPSVHKPKFGWGPENHSSIGVFLREAYGIQHVDFPGNRDWMAAPGELEPAPYGNEEED